jgi:hypothetical protein
MAAADQYTNQLHGQLKYYATWLPGTPVGLGAIGTMQANQFIPQDDIARFGFKVIAKRDRTADTFEYSTKNGVDVDTKTAGSISPDVPNVPRAKAGMKLRFKRSDAVWFAASGCKMDRIDNQLELAKLIKDLYKSGQWKREWVVVTHVVKAASATVLVSASRGASAELEVQGKASTPLGKAEASTRSTLKADSSMAFKIVAEKGLTPLFRLTELSDGWREWFGDPVVGPKRARRTSAKAARGPEPKALTRVP